MIFICSFCISISRDTIFFILSAMAMRSTFENVCTYFTSSLNEMCLFGVTLVILFLAIDKNTGCLKTYEKSCKQRRVKSGCSKYLSRTPRNWSVTIWCKKSSKMSLGCSLWTWETIISVMYNIESIMTSSLLIMAWILFKNFGTTSIFSQKVFSKSSPPKTWINFICLLESRATVFWRIFSRRSLLSKRRSKAV